MTIIKGSEIPYLKKDILELYNNVTVIGVDKSYVKMNSLIFCAVSQFLKNVFHEENEEHTIITEFSFEELKQMKVLYQRILQRHGRINIASIRTFKGS